MSNSSEYQLYFLKCNSQPYHNLRILKKVAYSDSQQIIPKFIREKPDTSWTYLNNFLGELASKQIDSSAHTIDFFILNPALRKKFCIPRKVVKVKKEKEKANSKLCCSVLFIFLIIYPHDKMHQNWIKN